MKRASGSSSLNPRHVQQVVGSPDRPAIDALGPCNLTHQDPQKISPAFAFSQNSVFDMVMVKTGRSTCSSGATRSLTSVYSSGDSDHQIWAPTGRTRQAAGRESLRFL